MDVRSDIVPGSPGRFRLRDVSVRLARPNERTRWDALMNQHHYLDFKRFASRGLQYVVTTQLPQRRSTRPEISTEKFFLSVACQPICRASNEGSSCWSKAKWILRPEVGIQ